MLVLRRNWETLAIAAVMVSMLVGGWACTSTSSGKNDVPEGTASNLPLSLEWNLGQADRRYQVLGYGAGYRLFLSREEAAVEFGRASRVVMRLAGARGQSALDVMDPLPGKVNYFLGNRPDRWITDVPTFQRARYRGIYPGIDVIYYGQGRDMEHDFVVHPGADPSRIELEFQGVSHKRINALGDLVLESNGEEMIWKAPRLYQETPLRARVEGRYRIGESGTVGFEVGAYDVRRPLVIDPVILYASNKGGGGADAGFRMAVDAAGNTYLVGATGDSNYRISQDFSPRPDAANNSETGDVTVTKLNADGSAVVFTTRLGGLDYDIGLGIAVDRTGNMYVTGLTRSREFPTTQGAFRPQVPNPSLNSADRNDCFVTKIAAAGNSLAYSTYLGGTSPDTCTAIAVDGAGAAYLTGATTSRDFRPTVGAIQGTLQLGLRPLLIDAFVAKLKPDGSGLDYASYLGGNGDDFGLAIAVDAAGNAYVAGSTDSTGNFPLKDAAQTRLGGAGRSLSFGGDSFLPSYTFGIGDGFAVKVNPTGEQLLYGTYLGGRNSDIAWGIAVDPAGNAYVCGSTLSEDFPVSADAVQKSFRGAGAETLFPSGDGFVVKLTPAGARSYATYLGGAMDDRALAIAADGNGSAWVTGNTLSEDFPVSADAAQSKFAGHGDTKTRFRTGDAFLARLDPAGKSIVYASYLGGAADDYGIGVALDRAGNAYVSGGTSSQNFPTTAASAQPGYGGHSESLLPAGDAFVAKVGEAPKVEEPKPAIAAVASLASGVGGSIAPGQILAIGGTNLGPAAVVTANATEGSFATLLSDTRVLFGDTPAPVLSTSATLVTAVAPFGLAAGSTAQIVVEYKGVKSPASAVPVAAAAPGLFTVNGAGRGQATATNEDGSANSVDKRATAGGILTLIGTGAGVTDPPSTDGAVATEDYPPLAQPVTVLFGDIPAEDVFFSGGVKGRVAGFFQVQLRIPASVPEGEIPVTVKIGDAATQTGVTIAVAAAVPSSE